VTTFYENMKKSIFIFGFDLIYFSAVSACSAVKSSGNVKKVMKNQSGR